MSRNANDEAAGGSNVHPQGDDDSALLPPDQSRCQENEVRTEP